MDRGNYAGDSLIDGPMFLLFGEQQVKAWFDEDGKAKFVLIWEE